MALANFLVTLLTFIAIYSLFGIGLNVKFGFTGLIDFGHVAYFMVGAYVTVVLTMPPGGGSTYGGLGGLGLPLFFGGLFPGGEFVGWFLGVLAGMVAAAVVSLLVGVPTLRLREDYLAITALGIATILNAAFNNEEWLFNGPYGVRSVHRPLADAFPVGFGSFRVNAVVLGGLSVLALAYAGYRTFGVLRGVGPRSGLLVSGAVAALVAGFFAVSRVEAVAVVAGLVLFAVAVAVGRRALSAGDRVEPLLALAVVEVFLLWYVVQPLLTGSVSDVVRNVLWLFAPDAGPAGGLDYNRFLLLLSGSFLAAGYLWVQRTVKSPYGRVLRSVREDEDVPQALGKPTFRYKTQALMFGSGLAGAAGSLWAVKIGFIDPSQFGPLVTFYAFTAVIIGGTANNRGVVLGTAIYWIINSGTRFLDDAVPSEYSVQVAAARLMLIGGVLVVILYYRREGILGEQSYEIGPSSGAASDTEGVNADD
jgi:neutral amino acid transport system permease protein